ncbi:hypothetical protein PRZ48_005533 [Zasmidium cellare]|uniref:Amidohydrolase-related domain-containing protein n=1 Tax=Zasmidium cellare TaxID=395010 RepID=A0ABR0ELR2_ZASCE|nr:hypothetical protein PRZ48_005533 [Zasmidium cellare]
MSEFAPDGAWDTHLHILEPRRFPYKADRRYTPAPATVDDLLRSTPATNFLVVQASVENGREGLKYQLRRRGDIPGRIFRGEIEIEPDEQLSDSELHELHDLGVRAIRLHLGIRPNAQNGPEKVKAEIIRLARYSKSMNWIISTMCPLSSWLAIGDWLISSPEAQSVKVIMEHTAFIDTMRDSTSYPELDALLRLLKQGQQLFVKICGINRASTEELNSIPPGVLTVIEAIPHRVFWGSDWPHTSSEGFGLWSRRNSAA